MLLFMLVWMGVFMSVLMAVGEIPVHVLMIMRMSMLVFVCSFHCKTLLWLLHDDLELSQ